MSVTTTLAACSQTVSANGPDGAVDPPSTLDDAIRYSLSFIAQIRDTYALSSTLIGSNVLTNGDLSVSQTNGGALITPVNGSFPIDMFQIALAQPSKLQVQQITSATGIFQSLGSTNAIQFSTLASYTAGAAENFYARTSIEGLNFARFAYGTANAKAGSLQFKARASVAGTYSGAICNYAANRSYPFSFALAANTDTLIKIENIPGDTGGTWVGATNAGACQIRFDLGSGASVKSTANSWQAGNYAGVTGSTNLVSQIVSSTLTISDLQFEVGAACTKFERKTYQQNLLESQRYAQFVSILIQQYAAAGSVIINSVSYTPMRAIPTATTTTVPPYFNASAYSFSPISAQNGYGQITVTATGTGSTSTAAVTRLSSEI